MGFGEYDFQAHEAMTRARAALSSQQVFPQQDCHPQMNPLGVKARESRDSPQHPDSVAVIFALDVSGSMGEIPVNLATKTLPTFMASVRTALPSPQVLFIALGNAQSDRSPLQVGQFESEAALMDRWLSDCHLEGEGGGLGESYDLAMYFAARHTAIDCWEKRHRKGYLFMTGDEVPFTAVDIAQVKNLIGDTLDAEIPIHVITTEVLERYHTFFLIPDVARADQWDTGPTWRALLAERAIVLETPEDTAVACALLIGIQEGRLADAEAIRRELQTSLGREGEACERVVRAVAPFAEALARGPLAPPRPLGAQADPGVAG